MWGYSRYDPVSQACSCVYFVVFLCFVFLAVGIAGVYTTVSETADLAALTEQTCTITGIRSEARTCTYCEYTTTSRTFSRSRSRSRRSCSTRSYDCWQPYWQATTTAGASIEVPDTGYDNDSPSDEYATQSGAEAAAERQHAPMSSLTCWADSSRGRFTEPSPGTGLLMMAIGFAPCVLYSICVVVAAVILKRALDHRKKDRVGGQTQVQVVTTQQSAGGGGGGGGAPVAYAQPVAASPYPNQPVAYGQPAPAMGQPVAYGHQPQPAMGQPVAYGQPAPTQMGIGQQQQQQPYPTAYPQ